MNQANNDDEMIEIVIHSQPQQIDEENESKWQWNGLFKTMIGGLLLIAMIIGCALIHQSTTANDVNGRQLQSSDGQIKLAINNLINHSRKFGVEMERTAEDNGYKSFKVFKSADFTKEPEFSGHELEENITKLFEEKQRRCDLKMEIQNDYKCGKLVHFVRESGETGQEIKVKGVYLLCAKWIDVTHILVTDEWIQFINENQENIIKSRMVVRNPSAIPMVHDISGPRYRLQLMGRQRTRADGKDEKVEKVKQVNEESKWIILGKFVLMLLLVLAMHMQLH